MAAKKNNPKTKAKEKAVSPPAKAAEKPKRATALDAAARVLAEEGKPMSCGDLIAAMAAKKYWSSPGGKTPSATLYAAIARRGEDEGIGSAVPKNRTRQVRGSQDGVMTPSTAPREALTARASFSLAHGRRACLRSP